MELGSNENSEQADRARKAPFTSKLLVLFYCLPKEGQGGLTFLASQLWWIEQFPQMIQFFTGVMGNIVVKGR